jgi:hypothetical protein
VLLPSWTLCEPPVTMNALVEKIRRLNEMDLAEVRFRILHKLRIKRERWKLAFEVEHREDSPWWCQWDASKVANKELRASLEAGDGDRAGALLPEYFTGRKTAAFFWNVSDRQKLVAEFRKEFPSRVEEILRDAEALCEHRFRIFSYPEVECGPRIPWRRDLVHGVESPLDHHSLIAPLDFQSVGDSKIVWEINRYQHFFTLCEAYLLTGEERLAEECLAQWEHWLDQNPYLRGINWASSLEVAFRSWSLLWVLHFLLGSSSLTGERIARLARELSRNAEFIRGNLSTYFAPNTHLIGEGFALFVTGLLLPELKGSKTWREMGQNILAEEMQRQVRKDGSHIEQSTFYHRYAIEFFLSAAILADRNSCSFSPEYKNRLEKMTEYLAHTSWPSGLHPSIGDSDGGRLIPLGVFNAEDHRPILCTAAIYFQRGDFPSRGPIREQALWLLGPDAAGQHAPIHRVMPNGASRTFSDAGVVTMRSDWSSGAKLLLFDAGPQGVLFSGHGHADALSFVCSAKETNWLIDPGTFVYSSARPWRDFFRSTPAHNTIAIDDQDQAVRVDWFKWRELPQVKLESSVSLAGMDYAVASHDGYTRLAEPVLHRRHVVFAKPNYWFITDELTGQGRHRIKVFFHFAPEISVENTEHGWLATKGSDQFLLVPLVHGVQFRLVAGEISPIQGWYSKDYGHREPASVLVGEIETTLPVDFRWLLVPIESHLAGREGVSRDAWGISVITDHWTDSIVWEKPAAVTSHGQFSTDAVVAIVRRRDSEAQDKIIVIRGSSLTDGQTAILSAARPFDHFVAEWSEGSVEINASPAQAFRLYSDSVRGARVNGKPAKYLEDQNTLIFEGEI